MKLALAMLCVFAVVFQLRFLVALLRDWMSSRERTAMWHFAQFAPSQQRGELVFMPRAASSRNVPTGTDGRKAG